MFKINSLVIFGTAGEQYKYKFSQGINYFKGTNSSGKTEFYKFIDFMFGSSEDIRLKPWYVNSLDKASMIFQYREIEYKITRTREPNVNFMSYSDEEELSSIDLREYKDRLNSIFAEDIELLKDIRSFTEEELTYRTFTMFNFLGEKRQGAIHDFFDKCGDIKYSVKLSPILNFIFNNNLEKIYELKRELDTLLEKVKKLEKNSGRFDFICNQVNKNLQILGLNPSFTGNNPEDIREQLNEIKNMQPVFRNKKDKNISDLEVMYNNITEQIKVYENGISDSKEFEKDNKNRKILLQRLNKVIDDNGAFEYLISPLENLISELDTTISFSKYMISDNTIKELKKQRDFLKNEIKRNDSRFKMYSLEDKEKAIMLIEDYLSADISSNAKEIQENKRRIKAIRDELRVLQNLDDQKKVNVLSDYITNLYKSARGISSVVKDDITQEGFYIQYFKRGNILQPMIVKSVVDENDIKKNEKVNYYIGSMARHTLIQLCGYLGFLNMLVKEGKYPLIPILVVDHISKPFDHSNSKAIGKVIETAYESIGKDNLQLFMFDDEEYEKLDVKPDYSENLVNNGKTGFNPFYFPSDYNEDI
ncbi:hypothetical protein [Halobacillus sp. A5]|uniref:hypothetical protein n=1 Tax=Halobacillus sp. A5 TaxID=2880263 RepID=UPI0020A6CF1D|nr:hypothetical protein [Halobacillus sp. A5]MCP3028766.1 hypothetical protein [Halobacillus sp. A5]